MIINFFIFIFIIIISITLVPFFYKNVIMEFININFNGSGCDKKSGLFTMDILINFILLGLLLYILADGSSKMESNGGRVEFFIGLYGIIFLLISDIVMYLYKVYFPANYGFQCSSNTSLLSGFLESIPIILKQMLGFISSNWINISILFFACLVLIYVLLLILYYTNAINISFTEFSITIFFILAFTMAVTAAIYLK
jgi:hypothetical protein